MTEEIDKHTGEKWIVLDKEEIKMGFLAQCIEALAEAEGCDHIGMFNRMEAADMTEGYILRHYEPLHTQSWQHIVEDLRRMLTDCESK